MKTPTRRYKPDYARRGNYFGTWMTEAEAKSVRSAAKREGLTLSDFFRRSAIAAAGKGK